MPHALIIGASRGIGHEFVRQYRAQAWQVTATARGENALRVLADLGAQPIALDVTSAESTSRLGWQIDGAAFDLAVYCAGVYGPRSAGLQPPTQTEFDAVMHTNVLGAMRVLPALEDALAPGAVLAVVSSRMGSMGQRSSPSGWLYRASKAALNSVLKDVSLALGGRATCVALHPGWVRTDMGGTGAELTVADSVSGMRAVLAAADARHNGAFLNVDGQVMPW